MNRKSEQDNKHCVTHMHQNEKRKDNYSSRNKNNDDDKN
jgi:hypothetical protein